MEAFLEILKIILPAAMVFVATYIILRSMLENDQKKREYELRKKNNDVLTGLNKFVYFPFDV